MNAHDDEGPEGERSSRVRNVGGTSGGLGEFLIGLGLLVAGGYLFLNQVIVTGSGGWLGAWRGSSTFGLTLIPLFIGVAILFFNGRSIPGWLLTGGSAITIFVGVLAQLRIHFRATSLFNTVLILVLIAAGIGLVARSLRAH